MLEGVWYANFFVDAVPQIERQHSLPQIEMLVPFSTDEGAKEPWDVIGPRIRMLLTALRQVGFGVAADHEIFNARGVWTSSRRFSLRYIILPGTGRSCFSQGCKNRLSFRSALS
jgi:hypothetical protein